MEYFAGLDVLMAETHVCVMNREGAVIHEVKAPSDISRHRDGGANGRPPCSICEIAPFGPADLA